MVINNINILEDWQFKGLRFVYWDGVSRKGSAKLFNMVCHKCKVDPNYKVRGLMLSGKFKITKGDWLRGTLSCGCSSKRALTLAKFGLDEFENTVHKSFKGYHIVVGKKLGKGFYEFICDFCKNHPLGFWKAVKAYRSDIENGRDFPCGCNPRTKYTKGMKDSIMKYKCESQGLDLISIVKDKVLISCPLTKETWAYSFPVANSMENLDPRHKKANYFPELRCNKYNRVLSKGRKVFYVKNTKSIDWYLQCPLCENDHLGTVGLCNGIFPVVEGVLLRGNALSCRCKQNYSLSSIQKQERLKLRLKTLKGGFLGWVDDERFKWKCINGHINTLSTYSNLHNHKHGCGQCSGGHNQQEMYMLLLGESGNDQCLKVGIANYADNRIKSQTRHSMVPYERLYTWRFRSVDACKACEHEIKKLERGVLSSHIYPDGFTETYNMSDKEIIVSIIERFGGENKQER